MGCDCYNNGSEMAWMGGGYKFAVNMNCEGFNMDDDDWTITVTRGSKSVEYTKATSVRDEGGQWYICVDTEALGAGQAYITFMALVNDEDFPGGIRKDIQKMKFIYIQ